MFSPRWKSRSFPVRAYSRTLATVAARPVASTPSYDLWDVVAVPGTDACWIVDVGYEPRRLFDHVERAGLRPVEKSLQKSELAFVQRGTCCASRVERPPTKPTTMVTSVTITFNEQKP